MPSVVVVAVKVLAVALAIAAILIASLIDLDEKLDSEGTPPGDSR